MKPHPTYPTNPPLMQELRARESVSCQPRPWSQEQKGLKEGNHYRRQQWQGAAATIEMDEPK